VVCNDVLDENDDSDLFSQLAAGEDGRREDYSAASEHLAGRSTDEIMALLERCRRGMQRYRVALETVQKVLAMRAGEMAVNEDVFAAPRMAGWKDKPSEELRENQQRLERGMQRYETAARIAMRVLATRQQ
jgi:hypothetical protein